MADVAANRPGTGIALIDRATSPGLTRLLRFAALWLAAPLGLLALAGWIVPNSILGTFLLLVAPVFFVARARLDEFALAAALGFLIVGYVPALNHALEGDWRHVPVMAVVLAFMALFEMILRRAAGPRLVPARSRLDLGLLMGWLGVAAILPALIGSSTLQLAFIIPFALSLVHFQRVITHRRARRAAVMGYAIALLIFGLFYWNQFGRLLFGAMVAMPILVLVRCHAVRVPPAVLLASIAPLLWAAQWIRGDHLTAQSIANSSISGPSQLSVMMMEVLPVLPTRMAAFWDQWTLFFLGWVPRAFWSDKPVGLGWMLVDDLTSRRGVSEGHSIAPGLVGESLWLLGDMFVFGLAAQVFALFLLALLVNRLRHLSGLAAIIIAALLPTLVWGGMASFGARLWFFLFPVVAYAGLLAVIERRRTRRAV